MNDKPTPPTSKNQSPADLVSDLVACALIEGARPTSMTATMATKAAKQAVLDQLDLLRIGRVNAQRINDNGASEIDRLRALVAEQQRNCSCPYGDCSTCEKAKAALSGEPGSGHETCGKSEAHCSACGQWVPKSSVAQYCRPGVGGIHLGPIDGERAAQKTVPHFPNNETLRRQILNDPDDDPSAGNTP